MKGRKVPRVDGKKRKRGDSERQGRGKKQKRQYESDPATTTENDADANDQWADLSAYVSIIEEGPLCPVNFDPDLATDRDDPNDVPMPHGPDGLRYHVIDIWVDELEKVLEFDETEEGGPRKIKTEVPMELVLRPLEKLRTESPYKPIRTRAAEALDDDRLVEWGLRTRKAEDDDDGEQEWSGFDD